MPRSLAVPIAWCAAGAYGLFVAGITVISRSETHEGDRRGLMAGLILQDLALLGLAAAAMAHHRFPYPSPDRPLIPLEGILVIALIALVVNQAAAAATQAARLLDSSREPSRPASSASSGSTWGWSPPCVGSSRPRSSRRSGSRRISWAVGCTRPESSGDGR